MTTRVIALLLLCSALVAGLVGGAVGWGVAGAVSSGVATGAAGADGDPGAAGADGADGSDGQDGADAAGSDGFDGARGPTGARGATGPAGPAGPAGATGAAGIDASAAASFGENSAAGSLVIVDDSRQDSPAIVGPVPAGPTLMGYSVSLRLAVAAGLPITCAIADDSGNLYGATTYLGVYDGFSTTFEVTTVGNLPAPTALRVRCTTVFPYVQPPMLYSDLSIFAISFAP